ncbi:MAG: argininosuccinate lyase [Deltaproteobacteria bacterium]|nr:argininosuccinate lyase [Deltaproteobacteria bacterium]
MAEKVWGGRFKEGTDEALERFNASLPFDRRLYAQDIEGSRAHCRMLAKQGIIREEEASRMMEALSEILIELEKKDTAPELPYEDIHTLVERKLVEKVGPLGEKLHTGRSRNDQVALDTRMYVRDAIKRVIALIGDMQSALVELAEKHIDFIVPGYTHLQRAQPVLLGHHFLAYYEMLSRDRARYEESMKRVRIMPLGSAALAGTTFKLDRQMVARELGFETVSANSMDAVSDRDFVLEFLFGSSVLMMHLSRLSEELILWSTMEFGFVSLPDAFCTGSSIMPQKKNPDLLELVRGKTGRVYGHLMALFTTMKGLPLTYNKDMQEDKEGLFDTVDTVEQSLLLMSRLLSGVSFHKEAMSNAVDHGYLVATDLADYLVTKGVTFRQAHEVVGRMVLSALERGVELHELTLDEMKGFWQDIEEDVYAWLDPIACIDRRNIMGGTGRSLVKVALAKAREDMKAR